VGPETTVVDMGSTKAKILESVASHPGRPQYVAAHPMAGTEFSGPQAAVHDLFHGKTAIICDAEASGAYALNQVERMFKSLFMRLIYMDGTSHDIHAAYVSHISHISSFSLALTVLEKEKSEAHIFNLAAGGFASTVRLAKSSPRMWTDICEQNRDNLTAVMDSYIEQLQTFRELIAEGKEDEVFQLMEKANDIGRILHPVVQPGTPGTKNHNLSLQK
jgi:prephenate dehydrogenase